MNIIESIDDVIKNPYTFPGVYLKVGVTSDGGVLCPNCIEENKGLILESINTDTNDGWKIENIDILHHTFETEWNEETEEYDPYPCDNCGNDINEM